MKCRPGKATLGATLRPKAEQQPNIGRQDNKKPASRQGEAGIGGWGVGITATAVSHTSPKRNPEKGNRRTAEIGEKKTMLDFASPPAVGTVLKLDDQRYELTAVEPYTRGDGSASSLLTWRSSCPICGSPFDVNSGLKAGGIARRCAEHRNAAKPVAGKRGRSVRVTIEHA